MSSLHALWDESSIPLLCNCNAGHLAMCALSGVHPHVHCLLLPHNHTPQPLDLIPLVSSRLTNRPLLKRRRHIPIRIHRPTLLHNIMSTRQFPRPQIVLACEAFGVVRCSALVEVFDFFEAGVDEGR
jgi:hypothetical protein